MMNIQFMHTFLKIPHVCQSTKNFSSEQEPGQKFGSQKFCTSTGLMWSETLKIFML